MIRKIIAYKNDFIDFYKAQDNKVQLKIEYVLDLVRFERKVPIKFFKQLENTDGIYEVELLQLSKVSEFSASKTGEIWLFLRTVL